ncbi:hypothetical protein [Stutzerimonas kunmingensis]|uniref:hypothetical protein n=1 Tax=Stutzerimonas kunmingensis TaxID=1211807 RepID=UPI001F15DA00|nr:hypothetical protein [Stutzerimonas kunmingensis]UIP34456.1 hypothetical protein LW136_08485 [Stutzerimonas kunmingensis]
MIYSVLTISPLPFSSPHEVKTTVSEYLKSISSIKGSQWQLNDRTGKQSVIVAVDAGSLPFNENDLFRNTRSGTVCICSIPPINDKWQFDNFLSTYGTHFLQDYISLLPDLPGYPSIPPLQGGFWNNTNKG